MTAFERVAGAARLLVLAALVQGFFWAAAAGLGVLAVSRLLAALAGRPVATRLLEVGIAVAAAVVALVVVFWRIRKAGDRLEVALWIEERVPRLRYALVTLLADPGPARAALEARVADTSWAGPLRQMWLGRPLLALAIALGAAALLLIMPAPRDAASTAGRARGGETAPNGDSDPFRSFRVTVTPPSYSGLRTQALDRPETITALAGSALRVDGDGWSTAARMPDTATAWWLEQAGRRRLLALFPVPDSVPSVELLVPRGDSVLREGSGTLPLQARARDDYGLVETWLEYIVSAGEGENFTFRSGVIGRRHFTNARGAEITGRLSLDSLRLAPGNIVHLRAVARDGNQATGPGTGYSDTRTLRIARPGEGDSVSVGQVAPAAGDSSLLSQRMLIMMTEALERRRRAIARDSLVAESRRIAADQAALRRRVADIIFLRLGGEGSMEESEDSAEPLTPEALMAAAAEASGADGVPLDFSGDETPVVALNRPLLEAYNAMWSAGRELEIGAPGRALPHMRTALEAIQRARQAERIYLRGRSAPMVIDLAKVRLVGKVADAAPGSRRPVPAGLRSRETLLRRFTGLFARQPGPELLDSLQLLRIDALAAEPAFAAALGDAVARLRDGADATDALIQARRALAGAVETAAGLRDWDVAP